MTRAGIAHSPLPIRGEQGEKDSAGFSNARQTSVKRVRLLAPFCARQ